MSTWVKFHRKIEQWEWYTDANTFRVFFHLVLKANWEDSKWQGVDIKRGQHVTSPDKIAASLGLTRQKVRTALSHLESTNEITIKTTNKFTVVTVENYESYQSKEVEVTSKSPSKQPSINQRDNHQLTTNNNNKELEKEKEVKNICVFNHWQSKNIHVHRELSDSIKTQIEKLTKKQIDCVIQAIDNYAEAYFNSNYYYNNKWTLDTFIKQANGYSQWTEEGKLWLNYLKDSKPQHNKLNGAHSDTEKDWGF